MRWCLIEKTANPALETRGYRDSRVREFLRREGKFRCVYCAIHENALGGVRIFHVEHYKPKKKFPALINSLSNLYYACPICNQFKSDDWPAEPNRSCSNCAYPDPSTVDYSTLFEIDEQSGLVKGHRVASRYMIERLYFNRPQLILERKEYFLSEEMTRSLKSYKDLIKKLSESDGEATKHLSKLAELNVRLTELINKRKDIPSYELADVRRD